MEQLKQLKKELKAITQESIDDNLWFFTKRTGLIDRIIERITDIENELKISENSQITAYEALLSLNKNKKGA